MNRAIALLIPFAFACGQPQAGDTCDEDADCESDDTPGMICDMGTDETEGACADDGGTTPEDTDTDAT